MLTLADIIAKRELEPLRKTARWKRRKAWASAALAFQEAVATATACQCLRASTATTAGSVLLVPDTRVRCVCRGIRWPSGIDDGGIEKMKYFMGTLF